MKAYKGSPFAIVKEEWWSDPAICDHALCERFHKKNGCPEVLLSEWLILEIATGERMGYGDAYELRRDAVAALELHLSYLAKMEVQ